MTAFDIDHPETSGYESGEVRLWRAVCRGERAAVENILATAEKPNLKCLWKEKTMLYVAIGNGDYGVAEALLKAGADVNAPSGFMEYTPFILACDKADSAAIDLLMKYNADIDARTHDKETGLHRAAWHGHNDTIQKIVDLGCDVNAQNYLGQTAMHCAVSANRPETVRILMHLGADPAIAGSDGFSTRTPRGFAATLEQREDVAAVLDDPAVQEARKNKIYQPVTAKPVAVGKPLAFRNKPRP